MRTFPPEDLARALHGRLAHAFWLHRPRVDVTLTGTKVHATSAARRCTTSCYDTNGAEFLTAFHGEQGEPAWGRTSSRIDAVAVVRMWLGGATLLDLVDRYPFVDARKRAFEEIDRAVQRADARIAARVTSEIVHEMCDLHHMRMTDGDRAIRLEFYGRNPHPDAYLLWDECTMAQTTVLYPPTFAAIVRRWLVDHAPPSVMQSDFPWLVVRPEAAYYEAGRPIEGEFLVTWDRMEDYYADFGAEASAILGFLATLRAGGHASALRAGKSRQSVLLSRSRRHGLRSEQPYVRLQFHPGTVRADAPFIGVRDLQSPLTAPSQQFIDLLQALAALPID